MSPDPLYVASVADAVRSSVRNTDDPTVIRRYLHELRDTLYEADVESDLSEDLLDSLDEYIVKLRDESIESIDESTQNRITELVHRVERFCQRHGRRSEETDTVSIESDAKGSEKPSSKDIQSDEGRYVGHPVEADDTPGESKHPTVGAENQLRTSDTGEPHTAENNFQSSASPLSGKQQWQLAVATQINTAPTAGREYVYATTMEDVLYAVSKEAGNIHWETKFSAKITRPPVVAHQNVYALVDGSEIHAFDVNAIDHNTDANLWDNTPRSPTGNPQPPKGMRDVCACKDMVYFYGNTPSGSGFLYAMNPRGRIIWSIEKAESIVSIDTLNDTVYYISDGLYAIEKATGDDLWHTDIGEGSAVSVVAATDALYVISDRMYAVDAKNGEEKWQTEVSNDWITSCVVNDGLVCVYGEKDMTALDTSSGTQQWNFSPDGSIERPTIADGVVFVTHTRDEIGGQTEYSLSALDQTTGDTMWSVQSDSPMTPPSVTDGTVFVGDKDGQLKAVSSHRDQRLS